MSTTPTAVREALVTALEALTPASLATEGFTRYDGQKSFERMAADDIPGCFRKFSLVFGGTPMETPQHVNGRKGRWRWMFALDVAYPRGSYKSLGTRRAIDQARAEDFGVLWPALRDFSGAACVAELGEFPADEDEKNLPENAPVFVRIRVPFEFWMDV